MSNRFASLDDEPSLPKAAPVAAKAAAPKAAAAGAAPKAGANAGKPQHKKDALHKASIEKKRHDGTKVPRRETGSHTSGTGKTRSATKGGAGRFNWGSANADVADATAAPAAAAEAAAPVEEVAAEPAVPEPKVKGLADFLAEKASVKVAGDVKVARQVAPITDRKFTEGTNFNAAAAAKTTARVTAPAVVAAPSVDKSKKVFNIDEFNTVTAAPKKAAAPAAEAEKPRGGPKKYSKNDFPSL